MVNNALAYPGLFRGALDAGVQVFTVEMLSAAAQALADEGLTAHQSRFDVTDPVAVDATGARIIEAKRRDHFGEERPISPPPHHIQIADTRYGLGVSDPQRIDIVRLGFMEGALV